LQGFSRRLLLGALSAAPTAALVACAGGAAEHAEAVPLDARLQARKDAAVPHTWVHLGPLQQVQQASAQDHETMVINAPPVPGNTRYRVPGNRTVPPYAFTDNALAFVSVQSRAPDHAWELLKLLVQPDTFPELNRLRGRLPPRQSLWTKAFTTDKKAQEIAAWYGKHSRARYRPAAFAVVTAAINETVWAVVRDRKLGPRAGVEDLATRLNAIAQRNGYSGTTDA